MPHLQTGSDAFLLHMRFPRRFARAAATLAADAVTRGALVRPLACACSVPSALWTACVSSAARGASALVRPQCGSCASPGMPRAFMHAPAVVVAKPARRAATQSTGGNWTDALIAVATLPDGACSTATHAKSNLMTGCGGGSPPSRMERTTARAREDRAPSTLSRANRRVFWGHPIHHKASSHTNAVTAEQCGEPAAHGISVEPADAFIVRRVRRDRLGLV